MKLSEILTPEQILLRFGAGDKWQAIRAMPAHLVEIGRLPAAREAAAADALIAREESMTTGMEHGVAIPHAAFDGLDRLAGVLFLAPDGVPFEAIDGQPGRILVGLLIPRGEKLQHIRTLAEIAKLLSRESVRNRLFECRSPEQVLLTIRSEE